MCIQQVVCVEWQAGVERLPWQSLCVTANEKRWRRRARPPTQRDRCSQNNERAPAKHRRDQPSTANKSRSQQSGPERPKFSSQETKALSVGATSCVSGLRVRQKRQCEH